MERTDADNDRRVDSAKDITQGGINGHRITVWVEPQYAYGHITNDLHNYFRIGRNEYPGDLTITHDLNINRKGESTLHSRSTQRWGGFTDR